MAGAKHRVKGARIEREIVTLHEAMGVDADRVPLSGAAYYQDNGSDVDVYPFGRDFCAYVFEVKARGSGGGFRMLERWLDGAEGLFLRSDRNKPLVVLPWHTWERLLKEIRGDGQKAKNGAGAGVTACGTSTAPGTALLTSRGESNVDG